MIVELQEYIDEQNRLLENNSEFKTINIKCSIKENKMALKCCFTDMYDYTDKVVIAMRLDEVEDVKTAISEWVNHIVDGVHVVRLLNDRIRTHQKDTNASIRVIYKFGYALDDAVKVIDWDYNKIVIKLNKKTICNLINYSNNIEDIVNLEDYNCSIVNLVGRFNTAKLHQVIGASLIGDVIDILKINMLCRNDIINMIKDSVGNKGTQKIKSIFSVNELSLMAIFLWNIDFDTGIIETTLMDNKILNVGEDNYIRDSSICSAIHSLYEVKAKEIYELFDVKR